MRGLICLKYFAQNLAWDVNYDLSVLYSFDEKVACQKILEKKGLTGYQVILIEVHGMLFLIKIFISWELNKY